MRLHRTLGNLSPDEYEVKYHAQIKAQNIAVNDDR